MNGHLGILLAILGDAQPFSTTMTHLSHGSEEVTQREDHCSHYHED